MGVWFEIAKFTVYSLLIVAIAKYILVKILRMFAESLNLKPKTVGNIAGIATSMPELLSVSFAAAAGLMGTSIYNIVSSNIINLIQYVVSIALNKNGKILKNKALKIDIGLVLITILIPLVFILFNIEMKIGIIPVFLLLLVISYWINTKTHQKYLKKEIEQEDNEIVQEEKQIQNKKQIMIKYLIYILLTGIALFVVGNLLSNSLEKLCLQFNIPQIVIGIALGFITSLPELITFFESQKHHKKQNDNKLGVVEATNNLLTSNILNLFVIQSVGIVIYTIWG